MISFKHSMEYNEKTRLWSTTFYDMTSQDHLIFCVVVGKAIEIMNEQKIDIPVKQEMEVIKGLSNTKFVSIKARIYFDDIKKLFKKWRKK